MWLPDCLWLLLHPTHTYKHPLNTHSRQIPNCPALFLPQLPSVTARFQTKNTRSKSSVTPGARGESHLSRKPEKAASVYLMSRLISIQKHTHTHSLTHAVTLLCMSVHASCHTHISAHAHKASHGFRALN